MGRLAFVPALRQRRRFRNDRPTGTARKSLLLADLHYLNTPVIFWVLVTFLGIVPSYRGVTPPEKPSTIRLECMGEHDL